MCADIDQVADRMPVDRAWGERAFHLLATHFTKNGRMSVAGRRICERWAYDFDLDKVFACDRCGDTDEEGLCVYSLKQATRRTKDRCHVLCAECAIKCARKTVVSS